MNELAIRKLEVLLEAAQAAVQRTRFVFLAISVAGALILSAQFNVSVPWIRNVILRQGVPEDLKSRVEDFRWRELYVVSVPLLGMKFSAFDLGVVGSTGLAVLSVWFFYCARRENHVIDTIVREAVPNAQIEDLDRISYLYYGIAHHLVFLTVTKAPTWVGRVPQFLAALAVRVLEFSPIWVPLCVLGVDVWTLRKPHASGIHPAAILWDEIPNQHREIIIRCVFLLVMVIFSLIQCLGAARFGSQTRTALNTLRSVVDANPRSKSAAGG
jgi:hypothetical protein